MKKEIEAHQARSYKVFKRTAEEEKEEDFYSDLQFVQNPNKNVQKYERKQKLKDKIEQVDFFGYEIEPFHMKDERKLGKFDQTGHFVFDKNKDKEINDPWLQSLAEQDELDLYTKSLENRKKVKLVGNYKQGRTFFTSKKFSNKDEANQFYVQKGEDQKDEEDEEEEEKIEVETIPESKKIKKLQNTEKNELWEFDSNQLKGILVQLLDDNETPNQAILRQKKLMGPQRQVQTFKKNKRKENTEEQKENQQNNKNEEQKQEAQTTLNMLIDLCHIIMSKDEDPGNQITSQQQLDIYNRKKEDIFPPDEEEIPSSKQPNPTRDDDEDNIF